MLTSAGIFRCVNHTENAHYVYGRKSSDIVAAVGTFKKCILYIIFEIRRLGISLVGALHICTLLVSWCDQNILFSNCHTEIESVECEMRYRLFNMEYFREVICEN